MHLQKNNIDGSDVKNLFVSIEAVRNISKAWWEAIKTGFLEFEKVISLSDIAGPTLFRCCTYVHPWFLQKSSNDL